MSTTQCRPLHSPLGAGVQEACEEAAQYFTFVTGFANVEMWNSLSWWEFVRSLFGLGVGPVALPSVPARMPLAKRAFSGLSADGGVTVLIAPVDVEVRDCDYDGDQLMLQLRPLETARVRDRLLRDCRAGKTLEEAVQLLQEQLGIAARAPLFGPRRTVLRMILGLATGTLTAAPHPRFSWEKGLV